jgi:tripartite-type tricarboxylate transporter receptor subunit TctC
MCGKPSRATGGYFPSCLSVHAFKGSRASIACHLAGVATRVEVLPDIPTVGDFLPGYEASGWQGIGAPRNTPAKIIDELNKEIGVGLADPKIKARIAELGGTVLAGSPADFGKRVSEDVEKWAKVIKFAHIKSD